MSPLHHKKRNILSGDSYTPVEKRLEGIVRASQYDVSPPREEFRESLFLELRTKAFENNHTHALMKEKTRKRPLFALPFFFPVLAGMLFFAIIGSLIWFVQNPSLSTPGSSESTPLAIEAPVDSEEAKGLFSLAALNTNDNGIHPSTAFQLTAKVDTTVEKIRDALSFAPKVAYAIEETDEGVYRVTPEAPLPADTVLSANMEVAFTQEDGSTFTYEYSWVYQVQEKFQVISTLPRHASTYVPVDSSIEITLSHRGAEGTEEQFSITPSVKGRFETHRTTLVFVPEEALKVGTLYTVRLGKDVRLPSTGETLEKDIEFQFETAPSDQGTSYNYDVPGITGVGQITNEVSSDDLPTFIVNGVQLETVQTTTVAVYAFSDSDSFQDALDSYVSIPRWAYESQAQWSVDTADMQLYSKTEATVQDLGNYWQYAVTTPEKLPEGLYLVEIAGQEDTLHQTLLQVSNVSAYVTTSQTDLVVWAHDASTGNPMNGAEVQLADGTVLGKTDETGVLRTATPASLLPDFSRHAEDELSSPLRIRSGEQELFLPFRGNSQGFGEYINYARLERDFYWSYLYLDQPMYQPDDAVNFWGVVDQRDGGDISPATIQVADRMGDDPSRAVLYTQEVSIGAYGTFEGNLSLGNVLPGDYYVSVVVGDHVAFEKHFTVVTFFKPAYSLEVTPGFRGVISGEKLTHTVTAKTFDGTPVPQLELSVADQTVTTDDFGTAEVTRTYSTERTEMFDMFSVHPIRAEESEISTSSTVRVFPSSQLLDLTAESKDSQAIVTGVLYQLDKETFNTTESDFYEKPYGDVIVSHDVLVTVTREWSEKRQTGTTYDFIEKKSRPIYDYTSQSEQVFTRTLTTDAAGKFSLDFTMEKPDSTYRISVESTDDAGRIVSEERYAYAAAYEIGWGDSDFFHLRFVGAEDAQGFRMSAEKDFSIGDAVAVEFYRGNAILPSDSSFLFMQAQNGIQDIATSTDPSYTFTFAEEDVPNVVLQGVWFDGRSYWTTDTNTGFFNSATVASFAEEDRDMKVTVKTDKESYEPGDTVSMDIQATRPDGSTAETVVNVNLIDEAIYALLEKNTMNLSYDTLSDFNTIFYHDVNAGVYSSYASHRYPARFMGVEGGGGQGFRKDFPDKAFFQTVTTDAQGRAHVEFTLPDTVTSWRVTTHAITDGRYAGSATSQVVVTQPFFVTAVSNTTYLEGDQPVLKVRSFGTGLQQDEKVEIRLSSDSLVLPETVFETTGSESLHIPLPALSQGKHDIRIAAKSQDNEDGIIRSLEVLPSYMVVPFSEVQEVSSGWKPEVETDRNFEVTFTDEHIGQFYPYLQQYSYSFGDRLDYQVGRVVAERLLNEYFHTGLVEGPLNPAAYQTIEKGGLALFPYADADVVLSAHIAASRVVDEFDRVRLAQYFDSILKDPSQTTLRHAISLYGLASLHEPVLVEIRQVLASEKIDDVDRLYLALAFAQLGSVDEAREIFEKLQSSYGKTVDEYAYIELGENRDYVLENTLIMATIAAKIQDDSADRFFNYVRDQWKKEVLLVLPELNFVTARLANLPQSPTTIAYTHLGEEKSVELKEGATETVALTPETVKEFSVKSVNGKARAVIHYTRAASEEELRKDTSLSVTRSFEPKTLSDGKLVKITLNARIPDSAPDGTYQVTDFLPAGMQLLTRPYEYQQYGLAGVDAGYLYSFPYLVDGQRISFLTSKNSYPLVYYARVITPGTFTAEAAVVQSLDAPSVRTIGTQESVTIAE